MEDGKKLNTKYIMIAAMSKNYIIGENGNLKWNIPSELEWFRKSTNGKILLMGRKTFESIPVLNKNCQYIVLSKNHTEKKRLSNVVYISDINKFVMENIYKEVWICGGGEIYQQTLEICEKLYLTIINNYFDGDTYFPDYTDVFGEKSIVKSNDAYTIYELINKKISRGETDDESKY